jgi:hypothetical protein
LYYTTGLRASEILDLCEHAYHAKTECDDGWPPILGLYKSVTVTLAYWRSNRTQAELGETYGVSQPTISRAISAITPLVANALKPFVPTADELDTEKQYAVDGTLLPCWSWAGHRELYSGKHKTTGMNVQVLCTLDGELAWISDPIDGCHHDVYCLDESGALDSLDPGNWIGDKGYVGRGMATPIKKIACREMLDWEKDVNEHINSIRAVVERIIANFKTWRIMHTDYRRPLATFKTTIAAIVGLHFYRLA